MKWRYKALAYRILPVLPGGRGGRYLVQRFVTRSLPSSVGQIEAIAGRAREHARVIGRHLARPAGDAALFEFGAGVDLTGPLAMAAFGFRRQLVVDIERLLRWKLVMRSAECLARLGLHPAGKGARPGAVNSEDDCIRWLREDCGIDYRAPYDATRTDLAAGSIDCITSTNTVEHIPRAACAALLVECRRILAPGGVLVSTVDYQDHYAYCDPRISVYNFLQYSERRWRAYNPPLHYQNRMRHAEVLELFAAAGFELASEERFGGGADDLARLRHLRIDARFGRFSAGELAVRQALVAFRQAVESAASVGSVPA